MGVAIRTDADVVAVSFEATVVDVAASVVVSHVGAGNGAVGVRAFRSVPISHGEHGMESNGGNMYTERERDDESNEHEDAKCS